MTGEVAGRVWDAWRAAAADDPEWSLTLLFSTSADLVEAQEAFDATLDEIYSTGVPTLGGVAPETGQWNRARAREGLLVGVAECDDLDAVLEAVVLGLNARGVTGRFDLWSSWGVRYPRTSHLLACRMRVAGGRTHQEDRAFRWRENIDSYERVYQACDRWCRADRAGLVSLATRMGPIPIQPREEVLSRVRDAVAGIARSVLLVSSDGGFWAVGTDLTGGITVAVGGTAIEGEDWQLELGGLRDLVCECADDVAYGFVMRGWYVFGALLLDALSVDWPERPDSQPRGTWGAEVAFEDLFAPDAFGIQLLGPGYSERIADLSSSDWSIAQAGHASTLLCHATPSAWFSAPFVPIDDWRPPEQRPQPDVLREARAALAPILYSPGALVDHGFTTMKAE